jgi:cell division protein FtsI/penicillin-binding protein 2
VDRAGRPLATSRVVVDIGINPGEWSDLPDEGQMQVAEMLQIPSKDLQAILQSHASKKTAFIRIDTLPENDERLHRLGKTKEIVLQKKKVRYYPYKEVTAHLIGYMGAITREEWEKRKELGYRTSDMIGKTGMEKLYEDKLRGTAGGRIAITGADGAEKTIVAEKFAKNGETIKLTIDAQIQQTIFNEMQREAGTAAAIQPMTGEVLALASAPSYDPNAFVLGMSTAEWNRINGHPLKPLLNRFARGYAPGSTFKPITAAIGLETGALSPITEINIHGLHWQKDSSWGNYEVTRVSDHRVPVNLRKALVYSDNIYFAQAALGIGEESFLQEAEQLGFQETIPIPFPIEPSKLSNEGIQNEIQLADSGYGQGEVTMTPLHLALVYSAFVNEGNIIAPSLLMGEKNDKYWKRDVIPKEAAVAIRQDLIAVMEDPQGTGRGARVPGIRMAAKTGTAELKQKKGELGKENGWYVAFHTDNPRLLVAMMVEDVRGRGGSHVLDDRIKNIFRSVLK